MLKRMLERLVLRSAAKLYARRLGPQLIRDYGFSEHYTPAQIRASIERAKLPDFHIDFGYAAFLPEDSFKVVAKPSNRQDYDSLKRLMAAFRPSREPSWDEGSGGHPPPGVAS